MMKFFRSKAVFRWQRLLCLAIFASASASALGQTADAPRPDQVELASGSILFGEIKGASGGKLSFRSQNVGLITASFEDITHLRSDNPTVIRFMDGRVIRVTELDLTQTPFDVITESGVQHQQWRSPEKNASERLWYESFTANLIAFFSEMVSFWTGRMQSLPCANDGGAGFLRLFRL